MNNALSAGSLWASVSSRAALAAKFKADLDQRVEQDRRLREALIAAAPAPIREWLVEDMVLDNLFEYGRANRKITFNQDPFGSLRSIQEIIVDLQKAWNRVVVVALDKKAEGHRVGIVFRATVL